MSTMLAHLDPATLTLPDSATEWIEEMASPCLVRVPGRERDRCRALVTLLHGNEPSGLEAIHQWLRDPDRPQPVTDLALIIANVDAALTPPRFEHRQVPGERDLNRCFRAPWQDRPGRLARAILETLISLEPEAVLDVHNTSGSSPPFAVTTVDDSMHRSLAGLFTDHLVATDLRLGALMDCAGELFPTLTLECGGAADPQARAVASRALDCLARREKLFEAQPASGAPAIYQNPVRVELAPGRPFRYGNGPGNVLTLREDIETLNLKRVNPGEELGWCPESGPDSLVARDHRGRPVLQELLTTRGGTLTPAQPFYVFMATRREDIASGDCLFYAAVRRTPLES